MGKQKDMLYDEQNNKIIGKCDKCGNEYWIKPEYCRIPGCADITVYICKGCGKELYRCREDGIAGSHSDNVRLE